MRAAYIFLACLASRILFKVISKYDNYQLFVDSHRYDNLSTKIINGDTNMDIVAYLSAPLYPYTLAFFKKINLENWEVLAVGYQFLLVALSAVVIYKITKLLFDSETTATLASAIYILYPMTFWFNFTLTQETTFQCYFIFFCYFFLKTTISPSTRASVLAAGCFALSLLTKSHIVMLLPFLALIFLYNKQLKQGLLFFALVMISTIPHGLKNYHEHGVYTLSSHGNASLFLLGHSDQTYPCLLERAGEMDDFSALGCDPSFVFDRTYSFEEYGLVNDLSVKDRNETRMRIALEWIKANPKKFVELKLFGLKRFLMPGLDYLQYKFSYWVLSFISGLLLYLPAYLILFQKFKSKPAVHFLMVSLILVSAAIFIVFFPINRFRVITMEPLLCVYAAVFYTRLLQPFLKT